MDYLSRARRVIEIEVAEICSVADRLGSDFEKAVDFIKAAVENRAKVVTVGVGKSGHIGEKIAATLTSTGSPAVVLNSLNALHGDLGMVNDGDVVLAFSYSGETEELLNLVPALARFDVRLIAVTGAPQSTLARAAHAVLDVQVAQEACPLNLAPTSSTTAMLVLGDALAMVLLEARGFNKEDFARFHPGGRLGRTLLLKVRQIMRGQNEFTQVAPDTQVVEVIEQMTDRRTGAAVVVNGTGRLEGVFTHGDFARHFLTTPNIGERPVSEFMTRGPVTISGDKLAAEVLHLLQIHRVDDLVVIDAAGRPIGVVDSQDLSRLKIL